MYFRQILHEDLGCASYVIADAGEAAVVDPKWEIGDYLELAVDGGFRIAHVVETHNHADHVSGRGRLAEATGATIHAPEGADAQYEHEPLRDGDAIELGDVRIEAIATPGHRPEHTALLVADRSRGDEAWVLLSGDSLFVGDVARPDLAVEPEEGARGLFASVRRLLELGDYVEVYPGHIGGSLCGGAAMSKKPGSTIGFERRFNPLLSLDDEAAFVRELTAGLAPQPPNFGRIVELNRGPLVTDTAGAEPLAPGRVQELLESGAVLLDGREPREFAAEHVPGSLNVTLTRQAVGTRAAWVVDAEADVVVVTGSDSDSRRMLELLEAVGLRRLRGFVAGGIGAWKASGLPIQTTEAIDLGTLASRLQRGDVVLLDVRDENEWEEGHVPGSVHVPYYDLRDGPPADLPRNGKPIAVACSVGNRSSLAASLLRRAGIEGVQHVAEGGIADLAGEGVELVRGE